MGVPGLPAGLLTFVFTDIEGSTRLHRTLGSRYPALLDRHGALVQQALARHGGTLVQTTGDGAFAVFTDSSAALTACAEVQRALAAEQWPDGVTVAVRMGLHTDTAAPDSHGGYTSIAVHEAARVCAAAHGGQVLLTDAVLRAAGPLAGLGCRDIGSFRLRDLDEPVRLLQLEGEGLRRDFPAVRAVPEMAHNVPQMFTSFVGREAELAVAADSLQRHRLVTVLGPGGVGKTRLAFQLAQQLASAYAAGAWVVLLANVSDAESVYDEVASVTGARDLGGRSRVDALVERLRGAPLLLVMDNCEHVADAVAGLVTALLGSCPELRVLATSREPLRLPDEQLMRLEPLAVPAGDVTTVDDLAGCEAAMLFRQRAETADAHFRLDDDNAAPVADICRRLDGVPLALELAAARVRHLPLRELAERLHDRLELLASTDRGVNERHRTLQATIAWSYQLLTVQEQRLFRRLAVFRAPFTLDAAEQVCADADLPAESVLDLLAELVDKSLVLLADTREALRYRMLVTIAGYAEKELARAGEVEAMRSAHQGYVLRRMSALSPVSVEEEPASIYLTLRELESDAQTVLDLALADGDALTAQLVASRLARLHFHRGTHRQGLTAVQRTLALQGGAVDLRAWLRYREALFSAVMGEPEAAVAPIEEAVALAATTTDLELRSCTWHVAGDVALMLEDLPRARRCYDEARQLSQDPELQVLLGIRVAELDADRAPAPEVVRAFREAVEHFRGTGDPFNTARCLAGLGAELLRLADPEATAVLAEAVRVAVGASAHADAALAATLLAVTRHAAGDVGNARALLASALAWDAEHGPAIDAMLVAYPDDLRRLVSAARAALDTDGLPPPAPLLTVVERLPADVAFS